jgi:hypothetical protein
VPFVFITGYDAWLLPEPFAAVPRFEKPVDIATLVRAMTATGSAPPSR